jgi:hypothetical protein
VRLAKPDAPCSSFDNNMRCCPHFVQPGRSIAATTTEETGLNSGMIHRADWAVLENSFAPTRRTMTRSVTDALFKIAQFEKLHPKGE